MIARLAHVKTDHQFGRHTIVIQRHMLPGISRTWGLDESQAWYEGDSISCAHILKRLAIRRLIEGIDPLRAKREHDLDRLGGRATISALVASIEHWLEALRLAWHMPVAPD